MIGTILMGIGIEGGAVSAADTMRGMGDAAPLASIQEHWSA